MRGSRKGDKIDSYLKRHVAPSCLQMVCCRCQAARSRLVRQKVVVRPGLRLVVLLVEEEGPRIGPR